MARKILFCDCGITYNPFRHTVIERALTLYITNIVSNDPYPT